MKYDIVIVGGGPAGLAAAVSAYDNGAKNILVLERDKELGGILNQCIHNGFGLHRFKEELTGPEYAERFVKMLEETAVEVKLDTMVLHITESREIHAINSKDGYMCIQAGAIVLAMGCRERTRGAIAIPGDRPAGIFTAGTAQRYINMEGYMCGKRVVILGSGDIGLIMARRMSLEGAKVLACVELMPYSNGLTRNIVQCLDDYDIPLYLSHTIIDIQGYPRVEKVVVAKVDENRRPIPGTEITFDCDTVLLSVGLIPENELSREAGIDIDRRTSGPVVYENMETSVEGIFACGNVVHVHDLVDFVSAESARAGQFAALYVQGKRKTSGDLIEVSNGNYVTYTVPQKIRPENLDKFVEIYYRVSNVFHNTSVQVKCGDTVIQQNKKEHLAPGEMEKVIVPAVKLKDLPLHALTVQIGGDE